MSVYIAVADALEDMGFGQKRSHVSDSPAGKKKADNKPSPARKRGEKKGRYRRTSVQKNIDDKADVDEKEKYRSTARPQRRLELAS